MAVYLVHTLTVVRIRGWTYPSSEEENALFASYLSVPRSFACGHTFFILDKYGNHLNRRRTELVNSQPSFNLVDIPRTFPYHVISIGFSNGLLNAGSRCTNGADNYAGHDTYICCQRFTSVTLNGSISMSIPYAAVCYELATSLESLQWWGQQSRRQSGLLHFTTPHHTPFSDHSSSRVEAIATLLPVSLERSIVHAELRCRPLHTAPAAVDTSVGALVAPVCMYQHPIIDPCPNHNVYGDAMGKALSALAPLLSLPTMDVQLQVTLMKDPLLICHSNSSLGTEGETTC